jgi:hypothetical protein
MAGFHPFRVAPQSLFPTLHQTDSAQAIQSDREHTDRTVGEKQSSGGNRRRPGVLRVAQDIRASNTMFQEALKRLSIPEAASGPSVV